ncbi:GNAT family N-acetyltransferase [Candidatus Leptofilum sp.]|uniref:GNAT family N-acetyltransferase n=1 Tax=Candidatus Leptofilum sp. TaxID=3241576 RepID=UPI003B5B3F02
MKPLKIRPFQPTDHDYNALIQMNRFRNPDDQVTVAVLRREDSEFFKEYTAVRVLGELDGDIVARGSYYYKSGSNQVHFALYVLPEWQETAVPAQMHRYLLAEIGKLQPTKIVSEPPENETFRTKLLEADGFELMMRFPRSSLDVRQVQLADYESLLENVRQQGIRFVTLTDVMQADPDWQQNIWQLFTQIEQDIPTPHPEPPTPFTEYGEYYKGDDFRPDSWAIAVDKQAEYVGMCVVNVMSRRPSGLFAGITGVIRSHRRRKIASALKLSSIQYAQENGFTTMYTDNEENNPMFQLNLDLGFKPLPAWTYYEKTFS